MARRLLSTLNACGDSARAPAEIESQYEDESQVPDSQPDYPPELLPDSQYEDLCSQPLLEEPEIPETTEGIEPKISETKEGIEPKIPETKEDNDPKIPETKEDNNPKSPETKDDSGPNSPETEEDNDPNIQKPMKVISEAQREKNRINSRAWHAKWVSKGVLKVGPSATPASTRPVAPPCEAPEARAEDLSVSSASSLPKAKEKFIKEWIEANNMPKSQERFKAACKAWMESQIRADLLGARSGIQK